MIITFSGPPGSGKTTIAKQVAKKLKMGYVSIGDVMRKIAKKRKISLLQLSKLAEQNPEIDKEIDKEQIKDAEGKDNLVIDSRLGAFLFPDGLNVYIAASLKTRIRRVSKRDKIKYEKARINVLTRQISERKRYKQYYNVDYTKTEMYDLVIDTTYMNVEKSVKESLKRIKKFL